MVPLDTDERGVKIYRERFEPVFAKPVLDALSCEVVLIEFCRVIGERQLPSADPALESRGIVGDADEGHLLRDAPRLAQNAGDIVRIGEVLNHAEGEVSLKTPIFEGQVTEVAVHQIEVGPDPPCAIECLRGKIEPGDPVAFILKCGDDLCNATAGFQDASFAGHALFEKLHTQKPATVIGCEHPFDVQAFPVTVPKSGVIGRTRVVFSEQICFEGAVGLRS